MKVFLLAHPIVSAVAVGALSGIASAAVTDYEAFQKWNDWREARDYNWRVASWRWFKGAVSGALAASPLGYLVS